MMHSNPTRGTLCLRACRHKAAPSPVQAFAYDISVSEYVLLRGRTRDERIGSGSHDQPFGCCIGFTLSVRIFLASPLECRTLLQSNLRSMPNVPVRRRGHECDSRRVTCLPIAQYPINHRCWSKCSNERAALTHAGHGSDE